MKSLRGTLIILAIFGAVILLYGLSFANEEYAQADIRLLKESAVALQRLRPDLAQGLRNYADVDCGRHISCMSAVFPNTESHKTLTMKFF